MAAKTIRRIGILTSGGDAPGMNAAVRAATRTAISMGAEVIGIFEGYKGLIEGELKLFNERDVSNIISKGGTILYSARCDEFKTDEGMQKAVATCKKNKIDCIVAIGGDGTFRGAADLTRLGIRAVGIPATIDNDITATEYSIGFDTAMNTVVEWVDRLRDTCESHGRCNVVEVMGRNAGHIALECGIATGALAIAISEHPFDADDCIRRIINDRSRGKRNFIVMVSEGMGSDFSENLTKRIERDTFVETKFSRLAHVQRGGSPTLRDRYIASRMGTRAIELLYEGKKNLVICMQNNRMTEVDIQQAITIDRLYKNKITQEELDKLSEKTRKSMEEAAKKKREYIEYLYHVAETISF